MQYLIGQLLRQYITDNNLIIRRVAIDGDMDRSVVSNILAGQRTATNKVLSRLMDIETLKEPLKDYIKQNIDNLDTATIIDLYNTIYNNYKTLERSVKNETS